MSTLYLGVRLPEKPFQRLKLDDINFTEKNIIDLKVDAGKILNYSHDNLELIYGGSILKDDHGSLEQQGVKTGSTIHVFSKQITKDSPEEPITDEQIQKAVLSYHSALGDIAGSSLAKAIRPEVLRKVLDAYPEFHSDLGAYAILKDSILVGRISAIESAKSIAKEYPILIRSAEFVTKTMKEYITSNRQDLSASVLPNEDSLSDSSSSEGDSPLSNQARGNSNIRQISRDQLSAALLLAGSPSSNSLSNIAQRNTNSSHEPRSDEPTATTSASSSGLISNSLFSNALSNALLLSQQSAQPSAHQSQQRDTSQQQPQRQSSAVSGVDEENLRARFAGELQTMREMGLTEDMVNIQALVVSNGDVESAINLVLSGLGVFTY